MRHKGFTLLELLISIGIISVIIAIGSLGYRDFSRRQSISASTKQLVSDLRLAQQYALSGYKPTGCSGTLERFEFVRLSNTSYKIQVRCTTGTSNVTDVKSVTLTPGTTVSSFSPTVANDTLGFLPVSGWTTLAPGGSDVLLTIGGSGTSFTQNVRIRPTGDINYE